MKFENFKISIEIIKITLKILYESVKILIYINQNITIFKIMFLILEIHPNFNQIIFEICREN